jgi:hypothetical protein
MVTTAVLLDDPATPGPAAEGVLLLAVTVRCVSCVSRVNTAARLLRSLLSLELKLRCCSAVMPAKQAMLLAGTPQLSRDRCVSTVTRCSRPDSKLKS